MTTSLAIEYIPRRMEQLGYGEEYYMRFVYLWLQPNETRQLNATSEFYILVEDPENISVDSDMGVFNLSLTYINQMEYEHQGQIIVTNLSAKNNGVHFIQVIPKKNNTHGHKQ